MIFGCLGDSAVCCFVLLGSQDCGLVVCIVLFCFALVLMLGFVVVCLLCGFMLRRFLGCCLWICVCCCFFVCFLGFDFCCGLFWVVVFVFSGLGWVVGYVAFVVVYFRFCDLLFWFVCFGFVFC